MASNEAAENCATVKQLVHGFRAELSRIHKIDDEIETRKNHIVASISDHENEEPKVRIKKNFQGTSILGSRCDNMYLGNMLQREKELLTQVDEMKIRLEKAASIRFEMELHMQKLESERIQMKHKLDMMMHERAEMGKKITKIKEVIRGDDQLKYQMKKEEDIMNVPRSSIPATKFLPPPSMKLELKQRKRLQSNAFSNLMLGRTPMKDQQNKLTPSTLRLPPKSSEMNKTASASFSDLMLGIVQVNSKQSGRKRPKMHSSSQFSPTLHKLTRKRSSFEDLMFGKIKPKENSNNFDLSNWQPTSSWAECDQKRPRHSIIPNIASSDSLGSSTISNETSNGSSALAPHKARTSP